MKRFRIRGKEYELKPGQASSSSPRKLRKTHALNRGNQFWVQIGGRHLSGEWVISHRTSETDADEQSLVAQFPGKIKKIKIQKGEKVQEGQELVVVEAMKMEFAIQAPFAGLVSSINVHEGQQIELGVKFVNLEKEGK